MWSCCSTPDAGGGKDGWKKAGAADKYKKHLTPHQVTVFREIEHFGPLKELKRMFNRADRDGSGSIESTEFLALLNLKPNAYTGRLLELFDANADGSVSFVEFIIGMARFK